MSQDAERHFEIMDEINNEKRAKNREDKVLQMAWQLYCSVRSNKSFNEISFNQCLHEAKQFIKTYEEMGK